MKRKDLRRYITTTPAQFSAYAFAEDDTFKHKAETHHSGVCEINVPLEKKTIEKIRLKSTESGVGSEFTLLLCWAEALLRGAFISQTPIAVQPTSEAL